MQGIAKAMQISLCMYTIEELVPPEHLVRKLGAALDLSFVREATRGNIQQNRPPGIDPVVRVEVSADRLPVRYSV